MSVTDKKLNNEYDLGLYIIGVDGHRTPWKARSLFMGMTGVIMGLLGVVSIPRHLAALLKVNF